MGGLLGTAIVIRSIASNHTIGTDHTGYSREAKRDPTQTIVDKRMGFSNLQEYLPMLFSEGVLKERITLEQFVAVTSTNAPKLFDMYPRKGTIEVGADADIVIWDPTMKKTTRDQNQFSNVNYSTYAGWEVERRSRVVGFEIDHP